ncbi:hypothetical protein JMJ77_0004718 [Colletotrichum scovillei]|uniref:Uncharacterized protein n=1 Tax=Colletotrichum scovillei TaxID=1209932 RepID=A0A9P7RGZ1_9PEZI|nr:hypothetical protein JMJ77_0004718 [Colletotrichum scovillei]KAG7075926.1 hypothetical protein JMJ76_0013200 [Colletotrichum scovillei]KAG7083106.1 hypothetical protein JMJ78_0008556 [Colletotrichum scovillei]
MAVFQVGWFFLPGNRTVLSSDTIPSTLSTLGGRDDLENSACVRE